jgi:hypothetical protein
MQEALIRSVLVALVVAGASRSGRVEAQTTAASASDDGAFVTAAPDQHEPAHPRGTLGLVIAGAALFAAPWALNAIGGAFGGVDPNLGLGPPRGDDLAWETFRFAGFAPLLGPWIQLASKPTDFDDDAWGAWLLANGLLQATGLGLLIAGLVLLSEHDEPMISVRPAVSPDRATLLVFGRF